MGYRLDPAPVAVLVAVEPAWVAEAPLAAAMGVKPPTTVFIASSSTKPLGAWATAKTGKANPPLKDVDSKSPTMKPWLVSGSQSRSIGPDVVVVPPQVAPASPEEMNPVNNWHAGVLGFPQLAFG